MRRQAFHRERTGDAGAGAVLIRTVVQKFDVGAARDGGVDFPLPLDPRRPPSGMGLHGGGWPGGGGVARDLPFVPGCAKCGIDLRPQRFQRLLGFLPDHVDLGVVGDGFQRDVRGALIDEAVADVVMRRRVRLDLAGDGLLFRPALAAVGEEVVLVFGGHQPGAGEGEGDARSVDGDPPPSPLFGDGRGGAGAAGGVENEIARVGSKLDAAFYNGDACLDNVKQSDANLHRFPPIRYR